MKIKKFEGKEMSEILWTIKQELGPDAVILSTREIHRTVKKHKSGFLSLPVIEVTAATESPEPLKKTVQKKTVPFKNTLEQAVQTDIYRELQEIKTSLASLSKPEPKDTSPPLTLKSSPKKGHSKLSHERWPDMKVMTKTLLGKRPAESLHETWLEMKVILKSMTEMRRSNTISSKNKTLSRLYKQLQEIGVDKKTSMYLLKTVKGRLSPEELYEPERVKRSVSEVIEGLIKRTDPFVVDEEPACSGAKVVALIGPTGVGKTTTVAKLGIARKEKHQTVTLVSLDDTEGLGGAVLKQYADRYGLSNVRISSCGGLRKFVLEKKKGELILIDTAGRCHLDSADVLALKGLMSINIPFETHLAISANTKGSDINDMVDRFSAIPIDALLFTKMDETQAYGPIFSAMGRKRKPVSYFTTGRRIPEDIEQATPKYFTDLMVSSIAYANTLIS